jgi:hypothetical protein
MMRSVVLLCLMLAACAPSVSQPAPSVGSALPSKGLTVTTSAELVAALAQPAPRDIVLSPGQYDAARPFHDDGGHRIHSAVPGAAVLKAGIVIGGSAAARDAVIEGVAFDVNDRAKTLDGAVIHIWGGATGVHVMDVTIEGHGTVGSGLMARQPDGLVVQHLVARGFTDYGIFVDASDPSRVLTTPALLEDVTVSDVARAQPRSSNGTAEACLWLGNTGHVQGAQLRHCAWMGMWTGTASTGSTVEDIQVDDTPVGVYLEHFTSRSTFQRMKIGPKVVTGVICEWADPAWGSKPACVDNLIQDSTIESCMVGIALGLGTTRTTVRRVSFVRQRIAGVVDVAGIGNVFPDNDYSAMAAGSLAVTSDPRALTDHGGAVPCSADAGP